MESESNNSFMIVDRTYAKSFFERLLRVSHQRATTLEETLDSPENDNAVRAAIMQEGRKVYDIFGELIKVLSDLRDGKIETDDPRICAAFLAMYVHLSYGGKDSANPKGLWAPEMWQSVADRMLMPVDWTRPASFESRDEFNPRMDAPDNDRGYRERRGAIAFPNARSGGIPS